MKIFAIFLSGFIFGALFVGTLVTVKSYSEKAREDMKAWDRTTIYSDAEARKAIKESGMALPAISWDLFYATTGGYQDHATWKALTVPRDQVWSVIEASLHKTKADFTNGIPEMFLEEIELSEDQKTDSKIDTGLWNPTGLTNPVHFSIREKGSYFEDWVVDEDAGRIWVTKHNL